MRCLLVIARAPSDALFPACLHGTRLPGSAHAEHFNDKSGVNSSFSCAAVPVGGWAPQADSRLFALESYWRPDASYSHFFKCTNGMCLREQPADANANNATQIGYKCRNGHTVRSLHTRHLRVVCRALLEDSPT
jgi:hypothetical protein